jgi:hypothetical protein
MPVRLVVKGTIVVIVPLITLLLLKALTLLAPVFNPIVRISTVDDTAQISVILILPSATFLRWSEIAGRLPAWTLPVVKLMTLL